jgi:ParB/RepB/Spo0J family partition protein
VNVRETPVAELHESPTNPRQLFGDLTEMADSIKAQGVLQPIVARQVGKHLEIVFGHRRFRAAKLAGLKVVPVIVREMGDVEVLEAQMVENLAREDVHPLELAEGYQRLMATGMEADEMAKRLGVSRSSIYTTLKLTDLVPEAKAAFLAGRIASTAAAVAIARVRNEKQQTAALKAVEEAQKSVGGALPIRAVQKLVQHRFMPSTSKAVKRQTGSVGLKKQEAAVHQRAQQLLLKRVGELLERKASFDDADVRLLVLALSETQDAVTERLHARGQRADKLSAVKGSQLRALLADIVLAQWVSKGDAAKAIARVYGVSWAECEKTAAALVAADGVFKE